MLEVHAITAPTIMTHPPENMAQRRPNLSEMTAAKGAVTIDPLIGPVSENTQYSLKSSHKVVRCAKGPICLHRVERADDGDLCSVYFRAECVHEGLHGRDGADKGAIVTVGTRTAKGDKDSEVELDRILAPPLDRGFLDSCE